MIWAFVDYENVGSLEAINLSDYEKVFVFCGPRNTKVKFGTLPSPDICRIELIGVSTMGNNNLDFHLAFYLGRLHEIADKTITFHIISNDSGFNGLVNHLKRIGRKCKKVGTQPSGPVKNCESSSLSDPASIVLSKLKQIDGRKRPRKRTKFINWIKSQCPGFSSSATPEDVCKELVMAQLVQESGTNITYRLGR
ncbi:PIN domain-containing protein [Desulfosarcina ovata]|uniref:PIN-like domain-containing protein n=1 Tax=Desulfosarcina ovata subsp. ovata TaxID=2752305 RepID=A0A5K8A8Y4_9BACT|nr:PIN domain-containing protein [Desulfosarcina ovata]BBO88987.1 hypothetical protein DSCOOX_21670 [Desulfosarcina ovata subsp. ovata]